MEGLQRQNCVAIGFLRIFCRKKSQKIRSRECAHPKPDP